MTPTRSQVLEAIQDALERAGWLISAAIVSGKVFTSHDMSARRARAALLALEGLLGPLKLEDQGSSRDHAQSTEKARAVDGLADPQHTGAE